MVWLTVTTDGVSWVSMQMLTKTCLGYSAARCTFRGLVSCHPVVIGTS